MSWLHRLRRRDLDMPQHGAQMILDPPPTDALTPEALLSGMQHCARCAHVDWNDISRQLWQFGIPPHLMDEARASVCRLLHLELDPSTAAECVGIASAVFGPDGIDGAPMFVERIVRPLEGRR